MSNDNFNEVVSLDKKEQMKNIETTVNGIIESMNNLPSHAMSGYITHYDYMSLMFILQGMLKYLNEEK